MATPIFTTASCRVDKEPPRNVSGVVVPILYHEGLAG